MSTLYDKLGIDKDASALAIKKGYFAMVRKYPPERFPDKFMEIRDAYETLSNENTRQEYDSILNMSGVVRNSFEYAQKLAEHGEFQKAIPILEEICRRFPGILTVFSLLGETYFNNGNTGKAISIYEQLVKAAPDNAGFAGRLAHAYLSRGWHKKAIDAFLKAIELDENNISLWLGLSQAYLDNNDTVEARNVLEKSLEHENEENKEIFGPIYFRLALASISLKDRNKLRTYLKKMYDSISGDEEDRENAGWALLNITMELMDICLYEEAWEIIQSAERLIPGNKEVKALKDTIKDALEVEHEVSAFEDDSYDDLFKAMVFGKLYPDEDIDDNSKVSNVLKAMQDYEFIDNINSYRKQINTFKEDYPALYGRIKDFLIQAMNPSLNKKILSKCEAVLTKNRKIVASVLNDPEFYMDEEDDDLFFEPQQPVRRKEPKVGRNDPCPCGSGKKYKKCCGK